MIAVRFGIAGAAIALVVGCGSSNEAAPDAGVDAARAHASDASNVTPEPPESSAALACPPTLAEFCAQPDNVGKCALTWSTAQQAACFQTCSGVQFFDCQGFHVANCPGDEGGGETYYFDPTTGALVAISRNASILPGGYPGCYAGPAAQRDMLFQGGTSVCYGGTDLYGCPSGSEPRWSPDGAAPSPTDGGPRDAEPDARDATSE